MKKILIITAIHLGTGMIEVHSQQIDNTIQYIDRQILNEKQLFLLDKHRTNLLIDEYSLFKATPEYFNRQNFLFELLGGQQIQLIAGDIVDRGGGYYSWFGRVSGTKEISHYVIAPGGIKGRFYCEKDQYIIIPLGNDIHILYNSRARNYKRTCATVTNEYEDDLNDSININSSQRLTGSCDIRLYVGFSLDALGNTWDIHQQILDYIDYFNVANLNSHTSFIVGLARSDLLTNYQETGQTTSTSYGTRHRGLKEFWDPNDGEIDIVHDRRARYDADMCILLVDQMHPGSIPGTVVVGQAIVIDARNLNDAADAFCIMVNWTDESTFAHEFGHLMGCEHDLDNASNPPAYSYGHGRVKSQYWHTIMAYNVNNNCDGCQEIQHWSNPGIRYFGTHAEDQINGDITGTSTTYDNDRVLDNAKSDVYNFQGDVTNKVLTVDEAITDGEFAGVFGTSTVEVDADTFTIEDGGHATFTAENRITFKQGFWAKYGSSVHARLGPCNSTAPQIAPDFLSTDIAPVNSTSTPRR